MLLAGVEPPALPHPAQRDAGPPLVVVRGQRGQPARAPARPRSAAPRPGSPRRPGRPSRTAAPRGRRAAPRATSSSERLLAAPPGAGSPAGTSGGVGSSAGGSGVLRARHGGAGSGGSSTGRSATRAASSAATASQVPESASPRRSASSRVAASSAASASQEMGAGPRRWSCSPLTSTPRPGRRSRRRGCRLVGVVVPAAGSAAGPPHVQLPQRRQLLEDDPLLPVELQQRQEAGDHLEGVPAVGGERPERRRPRPHQVVAHDEQLLGDADRRRVQVRDADDLGRLGRQRPGGQRGELLRGEVERAPRASGRRTAAPARPPAGTRRAASASRSRRNARRLLVGLVLQQPGEQQVAGLEQLEVVLVVDLGGGQQPGRLEVEQGGGDDQELAGLVEVAARRRARAGGR